MKRKHIVAITIASALALFALTACETKDPSESPVPWSEPASWEGQMPGMGPR